MFSNFYGVVKKVLEIGKVARSTVMDRTTLPRDDEWISANRGNGHRLGCYCSRCIVSAENRAVNRRLIVGGR